MNPRRFLVLLVLIPWIAVSFPGRAAADVQAILSCRQLPPGPLRADCLERASADLERQGASGQPVAQPTMIPPPRNPGDRIRAGVTSLRYQDGRPIFELTNGQVWYSMDRRHLTFKPGRSYVSIEKSPNGMMLHFEGSFFALQVVRKEQ